MVVVAQLVERWIVIPVVAGSNPVDHPVGPYGGIEQLVGSPVCKTGPKGV